MLLLQTQAVEQHPLFELSVEPDPAQRCMRRPARSQQARPCFQRGRRRLVELERLLPWHAPHPWEACVHFPVLRAPAEMVRPMRGAARGCWAPA
jgi:hypothetical protein